MNLSVIVPATFWQRCIYDKTIMQPQNTFFKVHFLFNCFGNNENTMVYCLNYIVIN